MIIDRLLNMTDSQISCALLPIFGRLPVCVCVCMYVYVCASGFSAMFSQVLLHIVDIAAFVLPVASCLFLFLSLSPSLSPFSPFLSSLCLSVALFDFLPFIITSPLHPRGSFLLSLLVSQSVCLVSRFSPPHFVSTLASSLFEPQLTSVGSC